MENVYHDVFELFVNLVKAPVHSFAVLRHFKSRCGNAACVCSLTGSEKNAVSLKIFGRFNGGGHVCALCNGNAAVCNKCLCVVNEKLILSCAGESNIAFYAPDASALVVFA